MTLADFPEKWSLVLPKENAATQKKDCIPVRLKQNAV
jgi:hypothetical protein